MKIHRIAVVFLAVLVVVLTVIPTVRHSAIDSISAIYGSVLLSLANNDRTTQNISALAVNPLLEKAAQMKADDMAARSYFAHNTPEGKTPWQWMDEAGYQYVRAGENLAVLFENSEEIHEAWKASPLHWKNILNSEFTEIGIATSTGIYKGQEAVFVVQMFGTPI